MTDGIKETYHTEGDNFVIQRCQDITDEFLAENRRMREEQSRTRCREYHKVASIPVIFVHKWLKEGFNIYEETEAALVRKLKADGLDDFLTTDKRM